MWEMMGRQLTLATRHPTTLAELREQFELAWVNVFQESNPDLYE